MNDKQVIFGRTYIDGAFRCAIAIEGRKALKVVFLVDGNHAVCRNVDIKEKKYFEPVPGYDSAGKMAKAMLRGRKVAAMSKTARHILQEVAT